MLGLKFECCFCGLGVESVAPDVVSFVYTTCFDGPLENQHDQQMYCHAKCLLARLHPSVKSYAYFLDVDPHSTLGLFR